MERSVTIQVFGKVQGVAYRASARRKAEELGITGTVENHNDGSVWIEATGADEAITNFIEWCRSGPTFARVEHLDFQETAPKQFDSFRIIRN